MRPDSDKQPKRTAGGRLHESVTMATVGRLAGVSQVTVSRALRDPSKVSEKTMKKVKEAIDLTGFVPNALAGALASKRSNLVTALVPSLTNITYSALITSFSHAIRPHGYQLLLSETGFDAREEQALITAHLSRRPDAMLLIGTRHTTETRRILLGAKVPVVEIFDITDTPIDVCVGMSHDDVGRCVARFVLETGYQNTATVNAADERAVRRAKAFENQLVLLSAQPPLHHHCIGPASLGAGRVAFRDLLERGFSSGLIFCSSDLLAQGVIIEAQFQGLHIPSDIAVIGFGDQEFSKEIEPPLTTVQIDRDALGQTAAQLLLQRLAGDAIDHTTVDLGFQIIRRRSA